MSEALTTSQPEESYDLETRSETELTKYPNLKPELINPGEHILLERPEYIAYSENEENDVGEYLTALVTVGNQMYAVMDIKVGRDTYCALALVSPERDGRAKLLQFIPENGVAEVSPDVHEELQNNLRLSRFDIANYGPSTSTPGIRFLADRSNESPVVWVLDKEKIEEDPATGTPVHEGLRLRWSVPSAEVLAALRDEKDTQGA